MEEKFYPFLDQLPGLIRKKREKTKKKFLFNTNRGNVVLLDFSLRLDNLILT